MSRYTQIQPLLLLAALALGGCAGNGEGLDGNGRPADPGNPDEPLTATFESIQQHVFTPICTECHAGATAPQGLRLDAANSYDLLVGVPSTEVPGIQRVNPGNPDDSYIIHKLEGRASVGAQMPFGGTPLPQSTIDAIRQWIIDGAQPAAQSAAADFQLVAVTPADADVVSEAPPQIMLGFNRELDATLPYAGSVRLEQFDPADAESAATIVPASISVPLANPTALFLTPRQRLAPGHYRLVLDGRNGGGVTDLGGRTPAGLPADIERVATTFEVERVQ